MGDIGIPSVYWDFNTTCNSPCGCVHEMCTTLLLHSKSYAHLLPLNVWYILLQNISPVIH